MITILVPLGTPPDQVPPHRRWRLGMYLARLEMYGMQAIHVWPGMDWKPHYHRAAGVLLIGGDDLDPETYEEARHPMTVPDLRERDDLELTIARQALNDHKPTLGVCRGMQVLAVAAGGKLHQHLPDITQEAHGPGVSVRDSHAYPTHDVLITRGSRLHARIRMDRLPTVSSHHQAVKDPGFLTVVGRSPGGIVEALEGPACFAIQGHPERMPPSEWDRCFTFLARNA